jgi:glycosyltransferase involved in cell wall biosynthesis/SAM-dependent methyltransferase
MMLRLSKRPKSPVPLNLPTRFVPALRPVDLPLERPKIGVVIVAYNAASTLAKVLDRVPVDFRPRITEVLVCDDHSDDSTYLIGLGYQQLSDDLPLTVIRHPRNLGYGGNQKAAYRLASQHGLDIVVLLHGDGQYAPELLPAMVEPLERGECDAVFGSRMMVPGAARRGGMPLYKFAGNRLLTAFENRMLQSEMTEFHSGYRAYRVSALDDLPLERNSDGFDFDTQIIIQLHDAGRRIVEIPIPTYYGDEICYVNGIRYASDICHEVVRYRLGKLGFGGGAQCLAGTNSGSGHDEPYGLKAGETSSHARILGWLSKVPPSRILDLGCSSGLLGEQLRQLGHVVVGVDVQHHAGVHGRLDSFVTADLDDGIPAVVGGDFDVILAADVIEHVRRPERLLLEARQLLAAGGVVIACVPNFGHWYPRTRTALGLFDYDQRGILDSGHVRFFTKRSFEKLLAKTGFRVHRQLATGLPIDVIGNTGSRFWRVVGGLDRIGTWLRPQVFAYQILYELTASEASMDETEGSPSSAVPAFVARPGG